ncbi:MAG: helix-turn-helix transcriptional regulator [Verrucomicrobia bacterium]|nr:helix-turn-helix transcriptional regulator [Deltaproteobacteria bacterium]
MPKDIITTREIGAIIRKRRNELGFSQEQLSEKVGVSYQQIQRYENGGSMLNVENVQRIAKALEIPVISFFDSVNASGVAEQLTCYASTEEKRLIRFFRDLTGRPDRQLAISVVRRLTKR